MAEHAATVAIPNRVAFKASEVCEIAKVQPYVLRSWESEFPDLGVSKTPGGPRLYRRVDVERVLRIRQLVFGEGLTLAGVRRRFSQETTPPEATVDSDDVLAAATQVEDRARAEVLKVKQGLRALLDLLDGREPSTPSAAFELEPPAHALPPGTDPARKPRARPRR